MDKIVRITYNDNIDVNKIINVESISKALSLVTLSDVEVVEVPSNKKVNESKEFYQIAEDVREQLIYIRHFDVEVEVITSALMFMKQNPKLTVSEALVEGFHEWIK